MPEGGSASLPPSEWLDAEAPDSSNAEASATAAAAALAVAAAAATAASKAAAAEDGEFTVIGLEDVERKGAEEAMGDGGKPTKSIPKIHNHTGMFNP